MTLEIRRVRAEEYEEAGRVTASAYDDVDFGGGRIPSDYHARLADIATRARHALVFAAVEGERIIGTVTLELDGRIPGGHARPPLEPGQANVRMLGVDPRARRHGIGRALMQASMDEARRAGKQRMTLDTAATMTAAQRLYESMGFVRGPDLVWDDGFRLRTYELDL